MQQFRILAIYGDYIDCRQVPLQSSYREKGQGSPQIGSVYATCGLGEMVKKCRPGKMPI